MNEADVSRRLLGKMRSRGYLVRKTSGSIYQSNLPDIYVCAAGSTVFLEVKLWKIKHLHDVDRLACPVKVTPQLISLEDHAAHGKAWYLVYVMDEDGTQMLMELPPHMVRSWIKNGPRGLGEDPPSTLLMTEAEWLARLHRKFAVVVVVP